ncbi:MAG: hypothetical protein KGD65_11505 [Candidatus Lokiarchaeota archaeon]|nr:hypothetical protein [Candidatus Lokiarchaeota archaeon]
MKKNKLITISILGMLLLLPFMIPAKAAPGSYVGVAESENYEYLWSVHHANWATFLADGMPEAFVNIFGHDPASNLTAIYWGWIDGPPIQAGWPMDIEAIGDETSGLLLASSFIFDNIIYTPVNVSFGWYWYTWPPINEIGPATYYVVSNTSSFAKQTLYGGMATTPYWLMGVQIAPNNMNWTEYVIESQAGLINYWGFVNPLAANTTMTALPNGYQMNVPVAGYENNTLPITITSTYGSNGALIYYSMAYGSDILYEYLWDSAPAPVITDAPSDRIVPDSYTGESFSWTATDMYPTTYTITHSETATNVVTATAWTSGVPVVYNITDGLALGDHTYIITFENMYGVTTTDSVVLTIEIPDTTDPVITSAPSDITHTISPGDIGEYISWTATDVNAATYIVKVNGTIDVYATPWVSGTAVNYYGYYVLGTTTYEITFSDLNGNTVSDSVTITANPASTTPPGIPGFEPLIVIGIVAIGSIGLIVLKKKRK